MTTAVLLLIKQSEYVIKLSVSGELHFASMAGEFVSCTREFAQTLVFPAAEAFVSLATNDEYAMGALALGRSLRDANTTKTLVLLVTNGVSPHARYKGRTLPP